MNDTNATGNFYTIGHVVQFTGLTDRTIRSYLASGLLKGERINGIWHFTPEEVDRLVADPAVRPSILAKKNAMVYDFLLHNPEKKDRACLILDFPGAERDALAEYFCTAISEGGFENLEFSFDGLASAPRVFLKGNTQDMLKQVSGYYAEKG